MNRLSEYRPVVEVLEHAVASFDNYNDKYIKIIVRDAQLLVSDANNKRLVNRRVYVYSATLSKMRNKKRLCSYNPETLTKMTSKNFWPFLVLYEKEMLVICAAQMQQMQFRLSRIDFGDSDRNHLRDELCAMVNVLHSRSVKGKCPKMAY